MPISSKQTQAVIFRLLDKNLKVKEIAKEMGRSHEYVYQAIRQRFPNAKDARIPKSKKIEIEIGRDEKPEDTIQFYKALGYRYVGKYDDERDSRSAILIFAF